MLSKAKGLNIFYATEAASTGSSSAAVDGSGSDGGGEHQEDTGLPVPVSEQSHDVEMLTPMAFPGPPLLQPSPINAFSLSALPPTPTSFAPHSAPSSYISSLASSIKPSSSISNNHPASIKCKVADDDNSSTVSAVSAVPASAVSDGTTASKTSSSQKWHVGGLPGALEGIKDEISNLNLMFHQNNQIMECFQTVPLPWAPPVAIINQPTLPPNPVMRKTLATTSLLAMEQDNLSPDDIVTIMDFFCTDVSYADTYLVLADPQAVSSIFHSWLRKRPEDAAKQQ
ncbi:hypothetical protein PAXRUDRAFT_14047 [Paxillus rubicundulus Ve08.2h10]|uniref:Uncharacterized protein n=1 Tax=Paxillus rubicundulus Ve08.2h10 TaxID=930991 RepID=A0A0D0DSD3_9AGAM|nr:hypothetical protein PAXRUDRAFT_14047 [Paxillus rubicundulus Ve08.2h10]